MILFIASGTGGDWTVTVIDSPPIVLNAPSIGAVCRAPAWIDILLSSFLK